MENRSDQSAKLYLWTSLAVEPDLVGRDENESYLSTTKLGSDDPLILS